MSALSVSTPSTDDERLALLATTLDQVVANEGGGFSVGITTDGDGVGLAVRALTDHPVTELLGFRAPRSWWAFGVATTGSATPLADTGPDEPGRLCEAEARLSPGTPVRVVHLVARSGVVHSRVAVGHDAPLLVGDSSTVGLIDDVCRRVLGLATPPPRTPVTELWARLWLDDVLVTLDEPSAVTWAAVASMHPAVDVVRRADPSLTAVATDRLVMSGLLLADAKPWPVLREACAAGKWSLGDMTSDEAAWLDDGSFSRLALSMLPELDDLLDAASSVLPNRVMGELVSALEAWGLDTRSATCGLRPGEPADPVG